MYYGKTRRAGECAFMAPANDEIQVQHATEDELFEKRRLDRHQNEDPRRRARVRMGERIELGAQRAQYFDAIYNQQIAFRKETRQKGPTPGRGRPTPRYSRAPYRAAARADGSGQIGVRFRHKL